MFHVYYTHPLWQHSRPWPTVVAIRIVHLNILAAIDPTHDYSRYTDQYTPAAAGTPRDMTGVEWAERRESLYECVCVGKCVNGELFYESYSQVVSPHSHLTPSMSLVTLNTQLLPIDSFYTYTTHNHSHSNFIFTHIPHSPTTHNTSLVKVPLVIVDLTYTHTSNSFHPHSLTSFTHRRH